MHGYFLPAFRVCLGVTLLSLPSIAGSAKPTADDTSVNIDASKERRDWMNKGNAEYVQKHWETAHDDYLKAWNIKHHYAIAANLADVEMKRGHYAEAVEYLKYVLANVPGNQTDKRREVEAQLLECRNHLTAVRVAVDVSDATVLVDGRDVGQTPLREDLLLEPGKHTISVTKPGYGDHTEELSAQGSQVQITLTLEKAPSTTAPATPTPAPMAEAQTDRRGVSAWRIGSYTGFGVAAVGLGVGTYFVAKSASTSSDADSAFNSCKPSCAASQQGQIHGMDVDAAHQHNTGVAAIVVGGIGLATGITLFVLEPKAPNQGSIAFMRPYVAPNQVGIFGAF